MRKETSPRRNRKSQGFALLLVMALVTVLIMLLGALIGTNRTTFGLLRLTQSKDRADRTMSSVYSYCRFRLESDYQWGKAEFTGGRRSWSHLELQETAGPGSLRLVTGTDTENQTKFEVKVVNNLRTDGEVAVLEDISPEAERAGVPLGFCRLEITVETDGRADGVEVTVRNPGLVGAVCLSSDDLDLQAQSLSMLTRDPVKNQARADKSTLLTGMSGFLNGSDATPLSRGVFSAESPVLWSGEEVRFRQAESGSFQDRENFRLANPDLKDERFLDRSEALFGLPEFGVTDLAEVRAADGNDKPIKSLDPGVYRFEQYGLDAGRVRVLTVRDLGPSGDPGRPDGPVRAFYYMNELEPGGSPASAARVADLVGAPESVGVEYVSPSETEIHSQPMKRYVTVNSDGGAYVDLRNRRFVLDEKANFNVNGTFGLIGSAPATDGNPYGDDNKRQVNPALYFGDPERIAKTQNYSVGGAATISATSREQGSLKTRGKLTIQGDISGSATLAAGDDVTVRPGRFFDPDGDAEINFSIFSEGDVRILPPPILEDAEDRLVDPETGSVITSASVVNVSEKNMKLTGLLYAQGSVKIDLQDTVVLDDGDPRRNLVIEGAVVARRGGVSVTNGDQLELVYNPQFVDRLLPEVAKAGRRVEVTGWRIVRPSGLLHQD